MKRIMTLICFLISATGYAGSENISDASIYQIETKWTNQDGKAVELKSFMGRPVVFSMVYLSCHYLCPTVISEIKSIESKLDPKLRKEVQFVLLSFDPENDTAKVMKAYKENRKLGPQWTFLTAKKDTEIRELAVLLDFKYQKIEGGDFTHSFMILGLDEKGNMKERLSEANGNKDKFVQALTH